LNEVFRAGSTGRRQDILVNRLVQLSYPSPGGNRSFVLVARGCPVAVVTEQSMIEKLNQPGFQIPGHTFDGLVPRFMGVSQVKVHIGLAILVGPDLKLIMLLHHFNLK
jgi:hypothetical protein